MQSVADLTSMIGVSCRTTCRKAQEVTSGNAVNSTSADTARCLGCNAAGAHGADSAAGTLFAELTVWGLILYSLLPGISSYQRTRLKKAGGSGFVDVYKSQVPTCITMLSCLTPSWVSSTFSCFARLISTEDSAPTF